MPAHMTQQSFFPFSSIFYFGSNTKTLFTRFVALRFFRPFVLHSLGWRRRKDFSLFLLSTALRCSDANNLSHFSLNKDASPSRSSELSPIVHKFHEKCLNVHFDFGKKNTVWIIEKTFLKTTSRRIPLSTMSSQWLTFDGWAATNEWKFSQKMCSLFIDSHLQLFSSRF